MMRIPTKAAARDVPATSERDLDFLCSLTTEVQEACRGSQAASRELNVRTANARS